MRGGRGGERAVGAVVELAARREAARLEVGARTRTKNIASMLVTLDVSMFSGWLNFVAFCRVAREVIQGGVRCGLRCGLRRQGGGRLRCVSGMQARAVGARARALNMSSMVSTLDVFQLEMSSLMVFRFLKSPLMSVMPETSHSEMGP